MQAPSPCASAGPQPDVQTGASVEHCPFALHCWMTGGPAWPTGHVEQSSPHALPAHGSVAQSACAFSQIALSNGSPLQSAPMHVQPVTAVQAEPSHL